MFNQPIEPIDTCGCSDTGYLTTRTIPIDLAHGVGQIENVPVYHCRSSACEEFTLPMVVARRIEEIAELMEETKLDKVVFTWVNHPEPSLDPLTGTSVDSIQEAHIQAFTLQYVGREYEDAHVILVVPGQSIFLKSMLEDTEYYLLRYEAEIRTEGTWFSFNKFYYDEPDFTYEDFLEWSEEGHLKEIGRITMDEVEEALTDEFGEWE